MTLIPKDLIGMEPAGDGWFGVGEIEPELATGFAHLIERQRVLQNMIASARPPVGVIDEVVELLDRAEALLRPYDAVDGTHLHGRLLDIQGRGQALVPEYEIDSFDNDEIRGRITFGQFYRGGSGAIFGAAIPLFFDEIMSWHAMHVAHRAVTAYLNVNFRGPTVAEQPLTFTTRIDRHEGRKIFVVGTLMQGDTVLADLDGLWIKVTRS
jgi:acyl-coenzyme A thioesterase PaaI-like protein